MTRDALRSHLAARMLAIEAPHPVRVAIDGVAGSGKTTLANELATVCARTGRAIVRASIDGFHRPRAERYRRGSESPDGFYEDSFDYPALRAALLEPLGPGGNGRYRTALFDAETDTAVIGEPRDADADVLLIFDGLFLLRPEIAMCWDLHVFLDVPFDATLRRMLVRDARPGVTDDEVRRRFDVRYRPGEERYLREMHPRERAAIVIDNSDPARPAIVRERVAHD